MDQQLIMISAIENLPRHGEWQDLHYKYISYKLTSVCRSAIR